MNSRQFLIVVIITFVVGMVWLIADILFNTKASIPISDKLQSSLEPITPTFNARVLEIIQSETFSNSEILVPEGNAPVTIAEPEAPSASTTPQASPSIAPIASSIPTASVVPSPTTTSPDLTPLIQLPSPSPSSTIPIP